MLENIQLFSAIPLFVMFLALALGLDTYRRNHRTALMRASSGLMFLFSAAGLTYFLLINSATYEEALVSSKMMMFLITIIFGGFFYLSSILTYQPMGRKLESHKVPYFAVMTAVGLFIAVWFDGLTQDQFGWGVVISTGTVLEYIVFLAIAFATVFVLIRHALISTEGRVRTECVVLSMAVLMPFLWGVTVIGMRQFHSGIPREFSLGYLGSLIIFAFSIYRHHMFNILPISEDRSTMGVAAEADAIPAGSNLMIESSSSDRLYEKFLGQLARGAEGLIITRTYPDDLRQKYGLKKTPVIWLCTQQGNDRIDPMNLSIMEHTIVEFLKLGKDTVVAIDGIEYLISNNGTSKVLRMLYLLRDEVLMHQSRLIINLDPAVLDEKELALFERDFEVLKG